MTLSRSIFDSNVGTVQGGAINTGANATISYNIFISNTVTGSTGGAVHVSTGGTLTLHGNLFYGNIVSGGAGKGGAVYINGAGNANITSNTFYANQASGGGSGVSSLVEQEQSFLKIILL
jgi:predicted outer membrane repeat protein